MKKLFIITMFFLALVSCTKDQKLDPGTYQINGKVLGLNNGKLFLISKSVEGKKLDTLFVKNGHFIHQSKIQDSVSEIYLSNKVDYKSTEKTAHLYIEPKRMHLKLDFENFENAKLEGSKTQDEANYLDGELAKLRQKYKKKLKAFHDNGELLKQADTEEKKEN